MIAAVTRPESAAASQTKSGPLKGWRSKADAGGHTACDTHRSRPYPHRGQSGPTWRGRLWATRCDGRPRSGHESDTIEVVRQPGCDEIYAFEILQRQLRVHIEHFDTGESSRQGVVDGMFRGVDNGTGAVEVTTLTRHPDSSLEGLLNRGDGLLKFDGIVGSWHIDLLPNASLRKLRAGLGRVLRWFEANDLDRWTQSAWPVRRGSAEMCEWLEKNSVTVLLRTDEIADDPGVRASVYRPIGSWDPDWTACGITRWITEQLNDRLLRSKCAKLDASGMNEKHLFIFVEPSAAPPSVSSALMLDTVVPIDDLADYGFTHLWMLPRNSWSLLLWVASEGWARVPRHGLYDGPKVIEDQSRSVHGCSEGFVFGVDGEPTNLIDRGLRTWAATAVPAYQRWPATGDADTEPRSCSAHAEASPPPYSGDRTVVPALL